MCGLIERMGGTRRGRDQLRDRAEGFLPIAGVVDIGVVTGDIDLDVSAELTAGVMNGRVRVSQLDFMDPVVRAGSVEATLGEGQGIVDLQTVNGDIRVSGF